MTESSTRRFYRRQKSFPSAIPRTRRDLLFGEQVFRHVSTTKVDVYVSAILIRKNDEYRSFYYGNLCVVQQAGLSMMLKSTCAYVDGDFMRLFV